MKKAITIAAYICCLLTVSNPGSGQVKLPALIGDGMVIQRDAELKLWGWAAPGEEVTVRFLGMSHQAITGDDGKWLIRVPPVKAGGPYTMEITASNQIVLENILAGDVWVCAGQSNMVHYMELHSERYAEEIARADYPWIRQFLVPTTAKLEGSAEDLTSGVWKSATPEDVKRFSVVAYFFALHLFEKYHVPIGLINASVGGTPIEAWTSEKGLQEFPGLLETVQKNKDTAYVNSINRAAMANRRAGSRRKRMDKGLTGPVNWYDTAYTPQNWKNFFVPGYWEDQGVRDLDGVVWFRKEIELPASMTGVEAKIALGRIVDADEVYLNGTRIGNTTYQYPQRRYIVSPGLVKPGRNLLVVRVTNQFGKGGFVPDKPYFLTAGGDTLDLSGHWQYRVGEVFTREGNFRRGISAQNQPAALFNGMIAPLTDYTIKGFIWYQGESNADRPEEYKKLCPALISDWRNQWGQGGLPFLYVQLPNYMDVSYSPEESNWALLREAQLEALEVPVTGMAVTIDLGEWNDIHPDNKKPVGDRLALAARKVAYGEQDLVYSGPICNSFRIEGNKVILTFEHVGGGLVPGNGEELGHFAIAGDDGKFRWGHAVIENNTVVVWSDEIPEPLYVRYAWADNPDFANLYNREGLPASPFRTGK